MIEKGKMEARICSQCGGDVPGVQCLHCGRYYDQVSHHKDLGTDQSIYAIIDKSGSMTSKINETIQGFNQFLSEQQALGGSVDFTLVQFDDEYEVHHDRVALADVPPLDRSTYQTRGTTALLDAIGKTIANGDPARKSICIIITDGQENDSKEWKQADVSSLINKLDSGAWDFVFLGADPRAISMAKTIGIAEEGCATYANDGIGTQSAFRAASTYACASRTGSATGLDTQSLVQSYDTELRDRKNET